MKHYGDREGLRLLSYNAIFNEVVTRRNYGKTWTFKKRAVRRALKHGKKTLWLRLFQKEAKELTKSFFSSLDLQKYCGVSFYDPKLNPKGNIRREGKIYYIRKKPGAPWIDFIKIFALSDAGALRSCDDCDLDNIIFDEFTKQPEKYRLYKGNIATDLLDIYISAKREHPVKVFLLGNDESASNPINDYFKIKPLPRKFRGIKTFKKGTFAIQQILELDEEVKDAHERRVMDLLEGTTYGDYIYKGKTRNATGLKPRKTPPGASLYCQLVLNGLPVVFKVFQGNYYVSSGIDETQNVYAFQKLNQFQNERVLVKPQKRYFAGLVSALAYNAVYYETPQLYETALYFYKWLGV